MKKVIVLFFAISLVIPFGLKGQTEQGKVMLGLTSRMGVNSMFDGTGTDIFSLGFSSIKYKSDADGFEEPKADKLTSINFQPKIGVFVIDNLALGLNVSVTNFTFKDGEDDDKSIVTSYGIGPFIRYYFPASSVYPFIEADVMVGSEREKWEPSDGDSEEDKYSLFSLGGGAGVAIPLGKKVTFDVMAGYNSYTTKNKENNDDNYRTVIGTFGVRFGFLIFIGNSE